MFLGTFEVKNNHLYLSGKTNYPTTTSAFQTLYGYNDDGVLTRLPLVLNTVTTINNNFLKPEFSLYPNPANEFIYLKGEIIDQHRAVIYNVLGQLQINAQILNNKIDVLQLKEGVYFLKIDGFTYKFIKE